MMHPLRAPVSPSEYLRNWDSIIATGAAGWRLRVADVGKKNWTAAIRFLLDA